jgi:hypothetical protein
LLPKNSKKTNSKNNEISMKEGKTQRGGRMIEFHLIKSVHVDQKKIQLINSFCNFGQLINKSSFSVDQKSSFSVDQKPFSVNQKSFSDNQKSSFSVDEMSKY